jgi:cytoskeleton protein RodZ
MQHQRNVFRPKPDGDIDPAGEAGWFLQRERERRGETLADAAERCAIHPHHLEGIEAGDLTRLPPRIEALRMIGAYGAYLGFDPQPLVLHYAQFLTKPMKHSPAARATAPKPLGSATIISFPARCARALGSGSGGVVASLVVAVGLFGAAIWALPQLGGPGGVAGPGGSGGIDRLGNPQDNRLVGDIFTVMGADAGVDTGADTAAFFERMAETPVGSIATVVESPLNDTADDETARADADRAAHGLPGLGDFISSNLSVVHETVNPAVDLGGPGVGPGAGRIYGSENADARLVLKAKAPVWVRIEDQQGNVVLTQTLLTGDSYRVPNRSDLVIIARDGGLLTVALDGVEKGNLGAPGEILVGRPLDVETWESSS